MISNNVNQKIELAEFNIDENVKQIILGGLLGDGGLSKTAKSAIYCTCHSPKQKEYLFWKAGILSKEFRVNTNFGNNGPKYKIYRLNTNCSPFLNLLHDLYYIKSNKPKRRWEKIVNTSILEELSQLGLAVWYCDDGSYDVRDGSCTLATQGFSYEENLLLKEYFSRKWNIRVVAAEDYRRSVNKTYYKLVFHKKETEKFLSLIKDFVPESMTYKLGRLSEKNKELMESEDKRYKAIRKVEYYNHHDKHLARVAKYRDSNRVLINKKRVDYYWNNLEKSQISGRETMRKRRLIYRERVNLINKNYYLRNKERINKQRRERLISDSEFRERKNKQLRAWWNRNKETISQKRRLEYQNNKDAINQKRREKYRRMKEEIQNATVH